MIKGHWFVAVSYLFLHVITCLTANASLTTVSTEYEEETDLSANSGYNDMTIGHPTERNLQKECNLVQILDNLGMTNRSEYCYCVDGSSISCKFGGVCDIDGRCSPIIFADIVGNGSDRVDVHYCISGYELSCMNLEVDFSEGNPVIASCAGASFGRMACDCHGCSNGAGVSLACLDSNSFVGTNGCERLDFGSTEGISFTMSLGRSRIANSVANQDVPCENESTEHEHKIEEGREEQEELEKEELEKEFSEEGHSAHSNAHASSSGESEDGEEEIVVMYTVFNMAVITLAILLVLDFAREFIDEAGEKDPISKVFLETVYREFTTMGLMGLGTFLITQYRDDISESKEELFELVHVGFFYTSIFNAVLTAVCAIGAYAVGYYSWVVTEQVQVGHYMEIRAEFERIDNILNGGSRCDGSSENFWRYSAWQRFLTTISHPHLRAKYKYLLMQRQFKELRVQLLQHYHLPLRFQVSDYLMRSMRAVIIDTIEISVKTWLWVIAIANLLYFLMGVATDVSNDNIKVGKTLTVFFFASVICTALFSVYVLFKVEDIFLKVMKFEVDFHGDDKVCEMRARKKLEQLSSFWFRKPKLTMRYLQAVQFTYSILLGSLFVFWDTINKHAPGAHHFFYATLLSMGIYILCMINIVPRYTLSTSLGYLVDERRLNDALASYRLDRARHEAQERKADRESFHHDSKLKVTPKQGRTIFEKISRSLYFNFSLTMLTVYLVGMRLEIFLFYGGLVVTENTERMNLVSSFWTEFACLVLILLLAVYNIASAMNNQRVKIHRRRLYASIFDLALSGFCLFVLLFAESGRCFCGQPPDSGSTSASVEDNKEETFDELEELGEACCPFGKRARPEFGDFEPWTGLIFFRLFRFLFAEKLIRLTKGAKDHTDDSSEHSEGSEEEEEEEELSGTAVELWVDAVATHADVVEKHGPFSGELLQAMLGITRNEEEEGAQEKSLKYLKQGISLRSIGTPEESSSDPQNGGLLLNTVENCSAYPDATLITKMRRCHRKVLPFLSKWVPVDVVMTRFEILYFDTKEFVCEGSDNLGIHSFDALAATRGGVDLRLSDAVASRKFIGSITLSDIKKVHVTREHASSDIEEINVQEDDLKSEFWVQNDDCQMSRTRCSRWHKVTQDCLKLKTSFGDVYFRFFSDLDRNEERQTSDSQEKLDSIALDWAKSIGRIVDRSRLQQQLPNFGKNNDEELMDYLQFVHPSKGVRK